MESYVKITPATLTVQTNNGWKVYDGEPLVGTGSISGFVKGEEAEFIVTGQLTEVDKVPNTYEIKWEGATARADNYIIDPTLGELEVVHNTQKITVTTKGDTYTYDGTEHGAEVTVSTPLPKGYKVEKAVSNASVKDVTTEPVEVTCDELIIVNAAGKDVTKSLNIEYVNGTITVNPTTLYVTTFSDNKVYDGTCLLYTSPIKQRSTDAILRILEKSFIRAFPSACPYRRLISPTFVRSNMMQPISEGSGWSRYFSINASQLKRFGIPERGSECTAKSRSR